MIFVLAATLALAAVDLDAVRRAELLVVHPAQEQQQEVQPRRIHVEVRDTFVLGDPLESLFTDHRVERIHLRVVLRIAVFLAELADVVGEMELLHCRGESTNLSHNNVR